MKQIQKDLQPQKMEKIFHADSKCQQFGHLVK